MRNLLERELGICFWTWRFGIWDYILFHSHIRVQKNITRKKTHQITPLSLSRKHLSLTPSISTLNSPYPSPLPSKSPALLIPSSFSHLTITLFHDGFPCIAIAASGTTTGIRGTKKGEMRSLTSFKTGGMVGMLVAMMLMFCSRLGGFWLVFVGGIFGEGGLHGPGLEGDGGPFLG